SRGGPQLTDNKHAKWSPEHQVFDDCHTCQTFYPLSQTKPKLAGARHSSPLRRQPRPSLLRHHVCGVPLGPVFVALSPQYVFFVLSVGSFCTPKRARQIVGRCKGRRRRVDATGQPGCELLEQPAVAIRIMERGE